MSILLKNIDVIPMTKQNEILENTNIYIKGNKIEHIGELIEGVETDIIIEGEGMVAIPGLINTHTHMGMSLMRNYADDLDLMTWLTEEIWPLEAKLTPEDIYYASYLSMLEMIKSGTTCFNDMYFEIDRIGDAALEIGMRGVLSYGFVEDDKAEQRLNIIENKFDSYDGKGGLLKVFVAPHAPYTVGGEYLVRLKDLAKRLGTGLHIHLSETRGEVEKSMELHGKSPIAYVDELGLFEVPTIAAHCVHVDERDIEILSGRGVYVAHNPSSNLKLASGFAPIKKMLDSGVNVALGTDGPSSNNNQNMIEEMHLASLLAKAISYNPKALNAYETLEMATVRGAQALGMGDELGRLKPGYKADIVLVDNEGLHNWPNNNPISSMVYSAQGSDVKTVIIDGKLILEDGEFCDIDETLIKEEVKNRIARLKKEC